jgi:AcrR family transcriptional regulator
MGVAKTATGRKRADDSATPLSDVIDVLTRAAKRGELSANELQWSVARLSGTVRTGPRLDGVDRRDSIIRTAIAIFSRDGYNGTTLERIANELFITKAAVYHYFSSKQEILDAICERSSLATYDAIVDAAEIDGEPEARLRRMLGAWACMNQPGFTVLMRYLEEVSAPILAEVQRRGKDVEAMLRVVVDDGTKAGTFAPPDPHITVFGMLGAINYMYTWFKPDGRLPPEEVCNALVSYAIDGLYGKQGAGLCG